LWGFGADRNYKIHEHGLIRKALSSKSRESHVMAVPAMSWETTRMKEPVRLDESGVVGFWVKRAGLLREAG
jgi:hypothetical protein